MGENFDGIMDNYFEEFKEKMNNRFRIPQKLVQDYKDDICFMVDCDRVYIQVARPRTVWVKPLPYEVNIYKIKDTIEALINEPIDPNAPYFGTYEEAKARIELSIKLPQAVNKGRKRMAKMQSSSPLMLTKGKGEDIAEEEEEEESEEEPTLVKKKGKVNIVKTPKAPKAPKIVVFTKEKGYGRNKRSSI